MPDTVAYEPEIYILPLPAEFDDEPLGDVSSRFNSMCGAAEKIVEYATSSGQPVPQQTGDASHAEARAILTAPDAKSTADVPTSTAVIITGLLNEYDREFITNSAQIRNICINKLLEITETSKKGMEVLKAVELLGKVADVGLFVERTQTTIEHRADADLKAMLREKLNKLRALPSTSPTLTLHTPDAEIIDVTPAHTPDPA